ncbi:hypothetical protein C8Q80DRAFT_1117815 [Daedaleopsis nitida]|nr:hypothetical protein C8Q80DRAFT_1117815 [Daedaleopsis nitida]
MTPHLLTLDAHIRRKKLKSCHMALNKSARSTKIGLSYQLRCTFLLLALFCTLSAPTEAQLPLSVITPASLVQCVPAVLVWGPGGQWPFSVEIVRVNGSATAPLQQYDVVGYALQWHTNVTAGTSVQVVVTDALGATAESDPVVVQASPDSGCIVDPSLSTTVTVIAVCVASKGFPTSIYGSLSTSLDAGVIGGLLATGVAAFLSLSALAWFCVTEVWSRQSGQEVAVAYKHDVEANPRVLSEDSESPSSNNTMSVLASRSRAVMVEEVHASSRSLSASRELNRLRVDRSSGMYGAAAPRLSPLGRSAIVRSRSVHREDTGDLTGS